MYNLLVKIVLKRIKTMMLHYNSTSVLGSEETECQCDILVVLVKFYILIGVVVNLKNTVASI